MFKLFKYALLGLLMLDVAILPFSCFGPSTDEGELYIWVEIINNEKGANLGIRNFVIHDVEVGYVITEEDIFEILEKVTMSSKVQSYQVVKYSLVDGPEITMPYTVTEEAICTYNRGVRNAFNINVYLDVELYEEGEVNA